MGINTDLLKEKLNKFNKVKGEENTQVWRPTGKHTIRIVPSKDRPDWPFTDLEFHYLNGTILSPRSFGRRDPIVDFANSLMPNKSKEEYAQAKDFLPKVRTYVPVIVRGEEEKGVRLFGFSKTVYKKIIEMMNDEDIGDITDITHGRDLVVTYTPQEKSDTNYAKIDVMYKPSVTPLSTDKAQAKEWLLNQPSALDLFPEKSYAELKEVLSRYLDPTGSASEEEEPKSATVTTKAPAQASGKTMEDIMSELDAAFATED